MSAPRLTVEALAAGRLNAGDLLITRAALRAQADQATQDGREPLAANLRRAAELVDLPDAELLAIYESLRPGRSTRVELETLAARLQAGGAEETAALIRSAAAAYVRRGVARRPSASAD